MLTCVLKVGNILSTTADDAARRKVLSLAMEGEFLALTKRAIAVNLFPGLLKAVTPGAEVRPYNVPRGEQLISNDNKRDSAGQPVPIPKRIKVVQGGQYKGQAALDREGAPTPGSSRASSHQPLGAAVGQGAEPSGPRNPFSRPPSAGAVAMPFAKSANSTTATKIKVENEHIEQEQIDPSLRDPIQGADLQIIAKGATEYQHESDGGQQAAKDAQGQNEQVEGPHENNNPLMEAQQPTTTEEQQGQNAAQQQQQPLQQADQPSAAAGEIKPAYDDMLRRIETEVFHAHRADTPEQQLRRAPAVVALIEGTAGMILKQFQGAARATDQSGRRDHFLSSLNDTAFALLWVLESCALNLGGTALSAEVSRRVSRDSLVGALWGSVRLASAKECLDLVSFLPFFFNLPNVVYQKHVRD